MAHWSLIELQAALIHWGLASRCGVLPRVQGMSIWKQGPTSSNPYYDWTDMDSEVDLALARLQRRGNGVYVRAIKLAYRSDLPRHEQAKAVKMRYEWYRYMVQQGERFLLDILNASQR